MSIQLDLFENVAEVSTIKKAKYKSKIKQALIKASKNDEIYTPAYAVEPLVKYLPKNATVWECTGFRGNITSVLKKHGFKVIETHIDHGFNFLDDEPDFNFDIIITNPPYSLKNAFLERAYFHGKPFAFLMPFDALATPFRHELYRKNDVDIIFYDARINFLKHKKGNWFNSCWVCWKFLPKKIIFEELNKEGRF